MNFFDRQAFTTNSLIFVFLLITARCSQAFNLDVSFPVVKEGQTAGSFFGLSVALHEQVVGQKRLLLLVGAPKEKAEPGLTANETGDVYACPITTDRKDCRRLNLINSNPDDKPDPKNHLIEGMWLGVSIASQSQPGGRILACGHHYIRNFTANFRMIGKCFVRGNDLKFDSTDSQWQSYDEVCDPREDQIVEGMCLAGMSSAMTQSEIFLGAPGCFNWQGNTFSQWHNPSDEFDKLKSKILDLKRGNIYIGYSLVVDQGVLVKDSDTLVSGAPRDADKGSVIMAEVIRSETSGEVKIKATVTGEQIGSYFGNSVAVVDLDNDGWKDLIIGAPFYFDRKKDKGGAVYVFMNQNGSFRDKADVVLNGLKNSGFGMAVAAIGDVNQDGFQDFAVGAPFHSGGKVLIWTGSKTGISQMPSQVIDGKDIPGGGFQTFGYSISGSLDVDRNGYPDIAVGSLDDRVVILRSRPVIHLKTTFTVTPGVINLEDCDACIEAKVCFSYTFSTGSASSQKSITLQYTLEADQQSSRSARVRFLDNKDGKYTSKMSVNPAGDCRSLKLELVSTTVQDKVAPLVFLLSVSLVEPAPSGGQMLEDLGAFPVISQREALTARAEIHIQKTCGLDNKCESNLQMTATFTDEKNTPFPTNNDLQILHYTPDMRKLKLLVNVSNVPSEDRKAEDAYNALLNVSIPTTLSFSSLNPKNLNIQWSPESPYLLCTLGDPFKSNQRVEIEITFETAGITTDTPEIKTELQLSTLSDQNDLQPQSRVLMVEYVLQPFFNLVPSQNLRAEFSGKIVGESAMKSTGDIGSPVEFNITVDVTRSPLGNQGFLEVAFHWPYAVANGKWLLYLSEIRMSGTSESICAAKGIINPLNLPVSEHKSGRRKRDEASVEPNTNELQNFPNVQATRRGQEKPREGLNCTKGSALCKKFTCPLRGIQTSAILTVRARVWNSTMLEDYSSKGVNVLGSVTLILNTDKPTIKMSNYTREFRVDIDPAVDEELPYEAPLWIIIVSVLAGVVLLGLIVILLWKCGFFKRANTRELYEAKALKAEMKTQPSENDCLTEED